MPEFLERRYSEGARWYLAMISIVGYVLTKISVTIAAGGIVFEALMGIDFWTGALVVVVATGVYTVLGGLRAVLYTDLLQMFVLIGGSVAVTLLGLSSLGGWSAMEAAVGPAFLSLWKPISDPDFPWTGILFGRAHPGGLVLVHGSVPLSSGSWPLGDEAQARKGTIFSPATSSCCPCSSSSFPALSRTRSRSRGQLRLDQPDQALPAMIGVLLPVGLRGLVVAGLLAALMSSLSSVFNSTSTLVTWDIYRKLHPGATERRLVLVGRATTAVLVGFGLLWIPLMQLVSGQLYQYLQSVQAYISPPIAAVFLVGIAWRRANATGAIAALLSGFVLGMGRLVAELNKAALDGLLFTYADINFPAFRRPALRLFAPPCWS